MAPKFVQRAVLIGAIEALRDHVGHHLRMMEAVPEYPAVDLEPQRVALALAVRSLAALDSRDTELHQRLSQELKEYMLAEGMAFSFRDDNDSSTFPGKDAA